MGASSDFLFQGKPPPQVNTNGTTTTQIPAYLQQYQEGVLAKGNAVAAKPYQTYGGQRLADVDPALTKSWETGMAAAGAYQPAFTQAGAQYAQAAQGDASGAAQPYLNRAGGLSGSAAANPYISSASGMSATAQASPYLQAGTQATAGQIAQNMTPYMDGVIGRIQSEGARNLSENLLPAMGDDFIRTGQLSSTRHQAAAGKAMSDTARATDDAVATALDKGYTTAAGIANNDLNRQLQAGQTAGAITNAEQQNIGALGQTAGTLANNEQQNLGALGQIAGNLNSVDTRNDLDTGTAQLNLGKATQAAGLTASAAEEAVGRGQMGEEQKNLDLAYGDFKDQRDYQRGNVDFMSGLTRGQPNAGGTVYTNSNAPLPGAQYGPSTMATVAGGLSLANAFTKAKGGYIDAADAPRPARPPARYMDAPSRRPPPIRVPRRQREFA
jgi:hypothetical protein